MASKMYWELLPDSDLTDRSCWLSLGHNRYAAFRMRLLIVRKDGKESRFGPVIEEHNVAPNQEITISIKRERIVSSTETISEAIRQTATSRISDELAAKTSAELSAKIPGFSGKIQSEVLATQNYEITKQIEKTLSAAKSKLIQESEATEQSIKLMPRSSSGVVQFREKFWPRQLDVYLHSVEFLELSYRKQFKFLWQIRETIRQAHSGILARPIVSLRFYEPQTSICVCEGAVEKEIDLSELIQVSKAETPMPNFELPAEKTLEKLAMLAFPVTKAEKAQAASRPKRKAMMGTVRKPTAAKRTAAKKVVPRKTTRAAGAKLKTIKRRSAKG